MYMVIPSIIIIYAFSATLFRFLAHYLFGARVELWKNHIIIDRNRIKHLCLIDRINCTYCGFANGVTNLMIYQIDEISRNSKALNWWKYLIFLPFILVHILVIVILEITCQLAYNIIISRALKYKRISIKEASRNMSNIKYAPHIPYLLKIFLGIYRNQWYRMDNNLQEIESSWCPIRHYERQNKVKYPDHHKRFYTPGKLYYMEKTLEKEGTVLNRK